MPRESRYKVKPYDGPVPLTPAECRKVVLPNFASVERWKHVPRDKEVPDAVRRYLQMRGSKPVKATAIDVSAPTIWRCGCQTGYLHELRWACPEHQGALLGRHWRTGKMNIQPHVRWTVTVSGIYYANGRQYIPAEENAEAA